MSEFIRHLNLFPFRVIKIYAGSMLSYSMHFTRGDAKCPAQRRAVTSAKGKATKRTTLHVRPETITKWNIHFVTLWRR
jgi:hypothetical protein